MPGLEPYLTFDGTCADAMRFYERALGGKLEAMMTHAESPMGAQASPENANRIMHARLVIDGKAIMASDSMAGQLYHGMHGFALTLSYPSVADAERVFKSLGEGGRIDMPLQQTFWAKAFGMLTDRFGTPWMVNVDATT